RSDGHAATRAGRPDPQPPLSTAPVDMSCGPDSRRIICPLSPLASRHGLCEVLRLPPVTLSQHSPHQEGLAMAGWLSTRTNHAGGYTVCSHVGCSKKVNPTISSHDCCGRCSAGRSCLG